MLAAFTPQPNPRCCSLQLAKCGQWSGLAHLMTTRLLLITRAAIPTTQTTSENWESGNRGRFRDNGSGIPRYGGRVFSVGE
jgi:hypothetical protein